MKKIPIEEVRVSIDSDFCQQCWSAHEYGVSKAHQKAEAYVIHCATTHQQLLDALKDAIRIMDNHGIASDYSFPIAKAIESASFVEVEE